LPRRCSGTNAIYSPYSSCTSAIESALSPDKNEGIDSVQVVLVNNSTTVVFDQTKITAEAITEIIEDLGYDAALVESAPAEGTRKSSKSRAPVSDEGDAMDEGTVDVKLSIEGMTCMSCVSTINNALEQMKKSGVVSYNVDLMAASGQLVVQDKEVANAVKSEIEDLGYDCKIMEVTEKPSMRDVKRRNSSESGSEDSQEDRRTVNVRIEGFFCEHCPAKANGVLEDLSKRFDITYTPSTLHDPTSSLTYTADPPAFTLRRIRQTIAELGFTMTIVKPETLQDRARMAQKRERHRLLIRLLVCVAFSIPTFIIGVVAPSLLSKDSGFRKYWETPVWGSAARYTVALFALATPIQFGVGEFFYKRAYKSIKGVWRKRRGRVDRTKVWLDRLVRWGSMDTLVALGTTTAWASSLAYMILDITSSEGMGTMAYFDTSVFLMTFILAGRYLVSSCHRMNAECLWLMCMANSGESK